MFVGADELGLKDIERVSRGVAVCSEWASCSLLILVSQNPLSSQALPKRRTDTASLHLHTATKPAFTRGSHSEVINRLQDNWGDHML